jgi:DNA repair ATPase RecN
MKKLFAVTSLLSAAIFAVSDRDKTQLATLDKDIKTWDHRLMQAQTEITKIESAEEKEEEEFKDKKERLLKEVQELEEKFTIVMRNHKHDIEKHSSHAAEAQKQLNDLRKDQQRLTSLSPASERPTVRPFMQGPGYVPVRTMNR